jgi:hypothetical protein
MPLVFDGTAGTIVGVSSGGLPANTITSTQIAANTVTYSELANNSVEGYMTNQGSSFYYRNKIMNSDFRVNQRNNPAYGSTTNANYIVDRFDVEQAGITSLTYDCYLTTDAPNGFANSLYFAANTASSGETSGGTCYSIIRQGVEAQNLDDLGWGTTAAKPVTVSFWVKSSVIAPFSVGLRCGGIISSTWCYFKAITPSATNTWQYVTFTIPPLTSSSVSQAWPSGRNGGGFDFVISLFSTVAGATCADSTWQAGNLLSSSNQSNSFIRTSGANIKFTGIQLEVGTNATAFERRPYQVELAMCQRYYYQLPPWNSVNSPICTTYQRSSTIAIGAMLFPVTMRGIPSINVNSGTAYFHVSAGGGDFDALTVGVEGGTYINKNGVSLTTTFASGSSTVGYAGELYLNAAGSILGFSAEL